MARGRAAPKSMRGQITQISEESGFGFIIDEQQVERFFHASMVKEGFEFSKLKPGQWVLFDPLMSAKGARATMVEPLEGEPSQAG